MILLGIVVVDPAVGQSAQSLCLDRAGGHARLRPDRLLRRLSQGDEADPLSGFAGGCGLLIEGVIAVAGLHRHCEPRPAGLRHLAGVSVLQGPGHQSRLVLSDVRRLHHRRRRQCREPDRRPRRPRHRAGDDRGGELRRHRLSGRQRGVRRLSADPFRAGHRRARGGLRRGDRRRARLSLVQRAAGLDLHGRHRFAGARRR